MDPALKQRLVGATVLVALGVIFVPMLLERGNDDARLSVQMEIPPQPDIKFTEPMSPQEKPIEPAQPLKKALELVKKPKAQQSQPELATIVQEAKPKPKSVKPNLSKKSTTQSKASASTTSQWIVQVGSFSRKANAEVLKDKLKSTDFNAFVETAQANTGPVYRVRIGPLRDRQAAEVIIKQLDIKGGYRGIVMSYAK